MIKYKLTNQALQTYCGHQWVLGKKETVANPGTKMCTDQVFHYYASPEQAVIFNPIHADIANPRLFEVEIDKEVAWDGLKGGCHEMTLVRELPLPVITLEQRVEFAIRVALIVCHDPGFALWARKWLSGEDRSIVSARAASWAASWAARAASWAAEAAEAAKAASWAARAAEAAGHHADFQPIIEKVLTEEPSEKLSA